MWISSRYLYLGAACALPFLILNALVALHQEFFPSLLRPNGAMTDYEQILILTLIALVGIGGLVALLPILKERRVYILNALIGGALLAFALLAGYELGKDFYHCEILQIPNCD